MKRQIKFRVEDGDSFERLTDNYFLGLGFKKFGESNQPLTYKKGSVLLNMVAFNPLNWKSTVTVTLKDQFVEAAFDINSMGQMVTPKEESCGTWSSKIIGSRSLARSTSASII